MGARPVSVAPVGVPPTDFGWLTDGTKCCATVGVFGAMPKTAGDARDPQIK